MTHLIFGQKENIFGYSNLKLNLFYTAGKLTQYYSKSFDEKIPSDVGGVEPDNIEEKVKLTTLPCQDLKKTTDKVKYLKFSVE